MTFQCAACYRRTELIGLDSEGRMVCPVCLTSLRAKEAEENARLLVARLGPTETKDAPPDDGYFEGGHH